MNLQQGDILTKKTKGETVYWLSERLVIEVCGISEQTLRTTNRKAYLKSVSEKKRKNEFLPDTGKSWRYAKTKFGFYYCYNNLPDRKPTFYKSKFGTVLDIEEAIKGLSNTNKDTLEATIKKQLKKEVLTNLCANTMRYYMYESEIIYADHKAKQLAEALEWCCFIKQHYNNGSYQKFGVKTQTHFLELCTQILQERNLEGLKVNNSAYLRNKINNFPTIGTLPQRNYLISGRYENDNARIVGKHQLFDKDTGEVFEFDAHEAIMYNAYMNPNGSGKEAIRQLYVNFYSPAIQQFGFEPIKYRTFCHHISKFHSRIKTARERHGADYFKKQLLTYVPSEKLKYAHSLFAGDGSGTITYKYMKKVKKKNRTIEVLSSMKLYVMLISDVASRKIVGYAFAKKGMHNETSEMMQDAVKMAIKNCDYKTMFEFISDNHGAFTSAESKDFLNLVFNKVRNIEAGNSQANPAETEFRLFKQSLRGLSNFGSTSWEVGIEGQANPDYMSLEDLPTYEEAVLQFYDIVDAWNAGELRDGTTPNQRFENKNPKCEALDKRVLRRIFGNHTEVDISYMRGFVSVSKTKGYSHRDEYLFEIPDYWETGAERISKACGYKKNAKVKVVWDVEACDLYSLDDKYIMTCMPADKASKSHAESSTAQENALGHHLNRKKQANEVIDDFQQGLQDAFDSLGEYEEIMPYTHEMAYGGNKESYNGKKVAAESNELSKNERIKRDFDPSGWDEDSE